MTSTKQLIFKLLDKTLSISYLPIYSELANSLSAGILLAYLMLKWKMNENKIFTVMDTELTNILKLKEDRLRHAKKRLQTLGIIHMVHDRQNHRSTYGINQEKLIELFVQNLGTPERAGCSEDVGTPERAGCPSPFFPLNTIDLRSYPPLRGGGGDHLEDHREVSEEIKSRSTLQRNSESTDKLSKSEKVQFIFDFWNEFKSLSKPGTTIRWQSHNKLTPLIEKAILQGLGEAAELEEEDYLEICHAIENYARALLSEETYYTHVWPLQIFLTVHETNKSTSVKKWQKFLNTNFVFDFYLTDRPVAIPEHDPAFYKAIVRRYGNLISNPQFKAQGSEQAQFAACAVWAKTRFKQHELSLGEGLDYFFQMLEEEFLNEGIAILPGHLASHRIWEVRFPQFLSKEGI